MRKLSALLLISVFVLSLAACKKNNTSSDASSTSLASLQSEQSESVSSEPAGETAVRHAAIRFFFKGITALFV